MLYPLCADTLTKSSTEVGKWHNIAKLNIVLELFFKFKFKVHLQPI